VFAAMRTPAAARSFLRRIRLSLQRTETTPRDVYLALTELVRRHAGGEVPATPEASLTAHELRVFSQNGEDGVIAELIARCGAPGRYFVEFGAGDGHENNCAALADLLGWSGAFLEADEALFAALEAKYAANDSVRTVMAAVTPQNVEGLLAAAGVPAEPDVLSVDVDGADLWIWRALERHRPRIVVIEYNSALGGVDSLVQPAGQAGQWDNTAYYGASIAALTSLAGEKGYRLAHTELTGTNAFFVRADLAGELPPPVLRGPNHFLAGGGHRPDPLGRAYEQYP
jgi:hypothetical protein